MRTTRDATSNDGVDLRRQDPRQLEVHLGRLLRRARLIAHLSPAEVAAELQLTVSRIASYEQGSRTISVKRLSRLAELYEVDIRGLLSEARWLQSREAPRDPVVFRMDAARFLASADNSPLARYVALRSPEEVLALTAVQLEQLAQLYRLTVRELMVVLQPWSVDAGRTVDKGSSRTG